MTLSDSLRIRREKHAPHYYELVRVTEDGFKTVINPILDIDDYQVGKRVKKRIDSYLQSLLYEDYPNEKRLPEAELQRRDYGAWHAPVGTDEEIEEIIRKVRIEQDMRRARREMERELKRRRIEGPIEDYEFGRVKKSSSAPHGKPTVISQRFEVRHQNGQTYTGEYRNIFDAGTVINFDDQQPDGNDDSDPVAHVSASTSSTPREDVLDAVRYFGDVPSQMRM